MNLLIKTALAETLRVTGALRLGEAIARAQGSIVFGLHRVLPVEEMSDCYNPYLTVTPESFDAFLGWLKQCYRIVSVPELLSSAAPVCCLTFDDGWEDNFRVAFPILQEHGASATIFLATGLIDTDAMLPEERLWRVWQSASRQDRLPEVSRTMDAGETISYSEAQRRFKQTPTVSKIALLTRLEQALSPDKPKRRSFMTWDQIRIMRSAGIDFGSHSVLHTGLGAEQDSVIRQELSGSFQLLRDQISSDPKYLAYPNGLYDDRVIRLAQETGYEAAFTTLRGRVKANACSRFELPRMPLDNMVANSSDGRFSEARTRLHILRESWPASREFTY